MSKNKDHHELMLATLGAEPQVITLTLDMLLAAGRAVNETTLIFTDHPDIKENLQVLKEEFSRAYPDIALRAVPVTGSRGQVKDFQTEEDLRGLLRALYMETSRARRDRRPVHICISGGRKVMAVIAMTVAQLLFGPDDQVWYLITEGWRPGAGRHLHAADTDKTLLLPVPVLRWNEADTLLRTVKELEDPQEVIDWYERLTHKAEEKRKSEFIRHWLTPAQSEVTRLVCQGLDNATIAAKLGKQVQTVANQLREVYEKLRELLDFPDYTVDRSVLIAQFAPYFTLMEKEVGR